MTILAVLKFEKNSNILPAFVGFVSLSEKDIEKLKGFKLQDGVDEKSFIIPQIQEWELKTGIKKIVSFKLVPQEMVVEKFDDFRYVNVSKERVFNENGFNYSLYEDSNIIPFNLYIKSSEQLKNKELWLKTVNAPQGLINLMEKHVVLLNSEVEQLKSGMFDPLNMNTGELFYVSLNRKPEMKHKIVKFESLHYMDAYKVKAIYSVWNEETKSFDKEIEAKFMEETDHKYLIASHLGRVFD